MSNHTDNNKPEEQVTIKTNPVDFAAAVAEAVKSALSKRENLLLDAGESAAFVVVSKSMWYTLNSEEKTPSPVRLNSRVRWRREELIAWTDAGCPNRSEWENLTA